MIFQNQRKVRIDLGIIRKRKNDESKMIKSIN